MRKRKPKGELQQFSFEARLVKSAIVTVEAMTEDEARELAELGDWVDEQQTGMPDFEIKGRVK